MTDWDYIVVGAGSSGCALVDRLSESGRRKILLLEAGSEDDSTAIRIPGLMTVKAMQRIDWGYRSSPDVTRGGKTEHWPRGRVVGGTSSVNGMNYVWGSAADYDRWARLGNPGWSAIDVWPLFRSMERCDDSLDQGHAARGRSGGLFVRKVRHCHPLTRAFVAAAQSAGHPYTSDYNGLDQEGIGYAQLSQRRGRRSSAANAFLRPALRRQNVELVVDARVHRLVIENRRVVGVWYERGGALIEARASRTILCAGTINSPHLLMLSGIGPPDELAAHGIAVVADRKHVGRNLREHPLVRVVCRVRRPTYNPTGGLLQKLGFVGKYVLTGEGPLASCNEAIAFLKTRPQEPCADVQLHVLPLGYLNDGSMPFPQLLPFPSMTVVINKNHPESHGFVRLASADPGAAPIIEPRMLESEADLQTLVRGVEMTRRILAYSPVAQWITGEVAPGPEGAPRKALEEYVRRHTEPTYHPIGTCRMGIDDDAVVDPQLQVRGVENLWIADASIMPDMISGNTNAACMMIGQKLGLQLARQDRAACYIPLGPPDDA